MVVFIVVRSGNLHNGFSVISKVAVGLFFLSINVYSSQLWAHTCRRLNPVKYTEKFYISDWDRPLNDNEKSLPPYLPVTLMSSKEKRGIKRLLSRHPIRNSSEEDQETIHVNFV